MIKSLKNQKVITKYPTQTISFDLKSTQRYASSNWTAPADAGSVLDDG
jgi:hypothetical protein